MSTLKLLAKVSVESVSVAVALVIVALLGFGITSIIGAALAYLGIKAILKSWIRDHPLPSPMQVFLYLLALFGIIGAIQFIIFAAVLIAVFLLKEVKLKAPTLEGLIESTKLSFLGIVMPIIGVILPIVPFYEAAKKFKYDLAGGLALLLLVFLGVVAMWLAIPQDTIDVINSVSIGGMFNDLFGGLLGPLSLANPLIWVGVIAYEEFIGRVTPFANAMFTLLHMPSRIVYGYRAIKEELLAVAVAFLILMAINFVARWLWDIYRRYGIVTSIAAHAFYNAGVGAFVELLLGNVVNFMVILFIGLVGFLYSFVGKKTP